MKTIICKQKSFRGTVELPLSKSESNRILILNALSEGKVSYTAISDAEDSKILKDCLQDFRKKSILSAADSGTAYRFLTAFLASREGEWILEGSDRMKERPIEPLVNALRELDASIAYLEKEGYPPLLIKGKPLAGGNSTIQADISSQFISALLMIGPGMKNGLKLKLKGKVYSAPYINQTINIMKDAGIDIRQKNKTISVATGPFSETRIEPDRDWSSAAFFYQLAASCQTCDLLLKDLHPENNQGDAVCMQLFEYLGVSSNVEKAGIRLKKNAKKVDKSLLEIDFKDTPDLFIPFVFACASINKPLHATGLKNLRIKESNRLEASCKALTEYGYECRIVDGDTFIISGASEPPPVKRPTLSVYKDHRLAMAFAVFSVVCGEIHIDHNEAEGKSFPKFQQNLEELGFIFHKSG